MPNPPSAVTELEIVIPKDKLNDLQFIYLKLMEVSLDTLQQIAKHSEKNFLELVNEFLPELKNLDNDEFLSRWKLSKAILNGVQVEDTTSIKVESEQVNEADTILVESTLSEKPMSKPYKIKISKKPKKIKLSKKPKKTIKVEDSKDGDKTSKLSEKTLKITKPKKIKLTKKKLKLPKKT